MKIMCEWKILFIWNNRLDLLVCIVCICCIRCVCFVYVSSFISLHWLLLLVSERYHHIQSQRWFVTLAYQRTKDMVEFALENVSITYFTLIHSGPIHTICFFVFGFCYCCYFVELLLLLLAVDVFFLVCCWGFAPFYSFVACN